MAAPYYNMKVGCCRKDVLEGHAPFCFNFFLQLNFTCFALICIWNHVRSRCFFFRRWVTWALHNIQRLVEFCILFPWLHGEDFGHVKLTAGGEAWVWNLAIDSVCLCVCFSLCFLSFPFLSSLLFGDRQQFVSLDFWIIDFFLKYDLICSPH